MNLFFPHLVIIYCFEFLTFSKKSRLHFLSVGFNLCLDSLLLSDLIQCAHNQFYRFVETMSQVTCTETTVVLQAYKY